MGVWDAVKEFAGVVVGATGLILGVGKLAHEAWKARQERASKEREVDAQVSVEVKKIEAEREGTRDETAADLTRAKLEITLPHQIEKSNERDELFKRAVTAEVQRDALLERLDESGREHEEELEALRTQHAEERAKMIQKHAREIRRLKAMRDDLYSGHRHILEHPETALEVARALVPEDPTPSLQGVDVRTLLELSDVSDAWGGMGVDDDLGEPASQEDEEP